MKLKQMNVSVVYGKTAPSRVTVTAENEVRIKIGTRIPEEHHEAHLEVLKAIAEDAILSGKNRVTLRGKATKVLPKYFDFQSICKKVNHKVFVPSTHVGYLYADS